jgi:hypothetical protein
MPTDGSTSCEECPEGGQPRGRPGGRRVEGAETALAESCDGIIGMEVTVAPAIILQRL